MSYKLVTAWMIGFIVVIMMGTYYHTESPAFMGITGSKEIIINFENPVGIKKIHVVPGQNVYQGDLLVEFNQVDLQVAINKVFFQLKELTANQKLNRNINLSLKSNNKTQYLAKQIKNRAQNESPLQIRIDKLKKELEILEKQKERLFIYSDIEGVIGSVNFKEGELVNRFAPILTIYAPSPSYVKGYIHENAYNTVKVGQQVLVTSQSDNTKFIKGDVFSVGSRIIPYPPRLNKYPTSPLWGREVLIHIPPKNLMLLGEKVHVNLNLQPKNQYLLSLIKKWIPWENNKSKSSPKLAQIGEL